MLIYFLTLYFLFSAGYQKTHRNLVMEVHSTGKVLDLASSCTRSLLYTVGYIYTFLKHLPTSVVVAEKMSTPFAYTTTFTPHFLNFSIMTPLRLVMLLKVPSMSKKATRVYFLYWINFSMMPLPSWKLFSLTSQRDLTCMFPRP